MFSSVVNKQVCSTFIPAYLFYLLLKDKAADRENKIESIFTGATGYQERAGGS